jgi:hypothetical protein
MNSTAKKPLIPVLLISISFMASISSCDSFTTVCTTEFRYLGVSVFMDDATTPVVFDKVILTDARNRNIIDLCATDSECSDGEIMGVPENGSYVIYHDGLRDKIGFRPMLLFFEGKNDSLHVEQMFILEDDGCHARVKAGPNSIYVGS